MTVILLVDPADTNQPPCAAAEADPWRGILTGPR
jgi:hypothetical protein